MTATRDLYMLAAGWLSGDAEAGNWLLDELVDDDTAQAYGRAAVAAVARELACYHDLKAALAALQTVVCDDPAVLGIADATRSWLLAGDTAADVDVARVHQRAGRRGAVTAAAVCLASAVELVCLATGSDPLAHVRARLLVLAADVS